MLLHTFSEELFVFILLFTIAFLVGVDVWKDENGSRDRWED